ncbi:MAG: hypothetical protein O6765_03100 [Gammaproteobacteria bacterium]|nr:hypothetical protein [Gammaproteobacteria bacterium]
MVTTYLAHLTQHDTLGHFGWVHNIRGQVLEVNEFDYKGINQVIYQENGVTIRSIPAIHGGREPFLEVVQKIYDDINAEYGTDYKVPTD